jgi:Ulp1 family protease
MLPAFVRTSDAQCQESPKKQSTIKLTTEAEIMSYIYSCKNPLATLVKIGKSELTQDDLKTLISGPISQKTIDCLLTVIKFVNSKVVKENSESNKILIAKTKFTQKVFHNEKTNSKIDIFAVQILVFPIFVGHWTVLTFNSKEMVVNYFDPLKNQCYLKEILKNLYRFLRRQSQNSDRDSIQRSLKELIFQKVLINDQFSSEDSSLFMLQTILNLSQGSFGIVSKEDLQSCRLNFLKLIFEFGNV